MEIHDKIIIIVLLVGFTLLSYFGSTLNTQKLIVETVKSEYLKEAQ